MDEILKQTLGIISNHNHDGHMGVDILRRLLDKAMAKDGNGNPSKILQKPEDILSTRQEWPVCELRILQQSMPRKHNDIKLSLKNNFGLAGVPIVIGLIADFGG